MLVSPLDASRKVSWVVAAHREYLLLDVDHRVGLRPELHVTRRAFLATGALWWLTNGHEISQLVGLRQQRRHMLILFIVISNLEVPFKEPRRCHG